MVTGFFEAKKLVKVILILLPILGFQFSLLYIHDREKTNYIFNPLGKCTLQTKNVNESNNFRILFPIHQLENEDDVIEKEQNELTNHIHQVCEANPQVCDQFLTD